MSGFKNMLVRSLVATFLSIFFCWVFYIILDVNVLDYLSKQDNEADIINYFYSIDNRKPEEESYSSFFEKNIVIVDLQGQRSRAAIAGTIRKLDSLSAKAIVLDIIFPAAVSSDPQEDQQLMNAITSSDRIYTAIRLVDGSVERSFYTENHTIPEGLVNKFEYDRPYEIINGDTLWYMAYRVTGKKEIGNTHNLINYRDKEFTFTTASLENIDSEDIADKIVLLGDLADMRDIHDMPFRVSGKWRLPGTVLMAYSISSVLQNDWILKLSWWWGILLAIIPTFLFTYFCYFIRNNKKIDPRWGRFVEVFLRILLVILLLLCGYLIFSHYNTVIHIVYPMLSIALTGLSIDILDLYDWAREKYTNKKTINTGTYEEKID